MAIAAHAGNWEYTVMGYGLLCRPGVVVGRDLDQPWAARLARYLRQRGGNFMVGKQRGMKGIMGHLRTEPAGGDVYRPEHPPPPAVSWWTSSAIRPGPLRWRHSWPGGGCRSCPPCPGAWRMGAPHGDLAAVAPDKDLRRPDRHPTPPGTPEPGHRSLGPDVPGTVALAPPALEKPVSGDLLVKLSAVRYQHSA